MTISHSFIVFIRYVIGGGLATVIHLAVLAISVEIYHFNPSVGTTLGFCIGTVFNYWFQYHLTFKAKIPHSKTILRYIVVTVFMMGLNVVLFWCLTEMGRIPYIYAQMLATIVIMFCNFAVNRVYTFSHAKHEGAIMNTIKKQKIFFIFFVAFVIRLAIFLIFRPWDMDVQTEGVLIGDSPRYHLLAECIVNDFTFCGDTFRTPGYPFFIAIFYALFGAKPWVVLFMQIFIDLITMYYVFKIGELIFSKRVGIIGAALLAIDPNSIFSIATLYSDSLFVTFLWASLYFYLRGLKLDEGRSFLIAGVLLALAALVRPVAQYYFLILFVFALLWPAKNFVIKLKYGVIYALAFVITISPWLYRNYALYDTVKLSSVQGENLLFWQVTYTKAWETHRSTDEISSEFMTEAKASGFVEGSNPFANEAIAQKIGVQYIKTHIQVCVSRLITGMVHTYTNLNTANIFITLGLKPTALPSGAMSASESEFKLISLFFQSKSLAEIVVGLIVMTLLLINYSMFLLGSGVLVKRRQWIILSLFVVSIMYFTATGGPIGLARFRLPIAPFYLLVGAVYIEQFLSRRAL